MSFVIEISLIENLRISLLDADRCLTDLQRYRLAYLYAKAIYKLPCNIWLISRPKTLRYIAKIKIQKKKKKNSHNIFVKSKQRLNNIKESSLLQMRMLVVNYLT